MTIEEMRRKRYLHEAWCEGAALGHRFAMRECYVESLDLSIEEVLRREMEVEARATQARKDREDYLRSFE